MRVYKNLAVCKLICPLVLLISCAGPTPAPASSASTDSPQVPAQAQISPSPIPSPSLQLISDEAQSHYDNALDYRDSGNFGLALLELDQALALSPGFRAADRAQMDISAQATQTIEQAQAEATRVTSEQETATALAQITPTRVRPDASVVLFDYQVVNEPLTKLEDSVDRVLAGLRTRSYLPGARQGALAVDLDGEAKIWATTRFPDPPRGAVQFHTPQQKGNEVVALLTTKPNMALIGFTEEAVRQGIGSVDDARKAHQALYDVLTEARRQLTETRSLLEAAKAELLQ